MDFRKQVLKNIYQDSTSLDRVFRRRIGTYFIVSHSEHGCDFSCVLNPTYSGI